MDASASLRLPIITQADSAAIDQAIDELERLARERRARTLREIDAEMEEAARLERSAKGELQAVQHRMRKLQIRRAAYEMVEVQS